MKIRFPLRKFWQFNPWQWFWGLIFNLCETWHINPGRLAPWMFGQMLGAKRKRVK